MNGAWPRSVFKLTDQTLDRYSEIISSVAPLVREASAQGAEELAVALESAAATNAALLRNLIRILLETVVECVCSSSGSDDEATGYVARVHLEND